MVEWLIFVPLPEHEPYEWDNHAVFYATMASGAQHWHGDNIKDFLGHCGHEEVDRSAFRSSSWAGLYGGHER